MAGLLDGMLIIVGLLLLAWGADRLVAGAAGLARSLGVPTLAVGLVVVSLGTSTPELLVNLTAQVEGVPAMAYGNVVGSNIANLGLVLGAAALVVPLAVDSGLLRREFPLLVGATILLALLGMDGRLGPWDGALLLAGFLAQTGWTLRAARRASRDAFLAETVSEVPAALAPGWALLWIVLGLTGLILGSRLLVAGAADLAGLLGMSHLVIGLTVVALGTSLPELAAALAAALLDEPDLVVGNVVGSCLLNILLVLGLPAVLGGLPAGPEALGRDLPVLLGLTLLLGPVLLNGPRGLNRITRIEGAGLMGAYLAYVAWVLGPVLIGPSAAGGM